MPDPISEPIHSEIQPFPVPKFTTWSLIGLLINQGFNLWAESVMNTDPEQGLLLGYIGKILLFGGFAVSFVIGLDWTLKRLIKNKKTNLISLGIGTLFIIGFFLYGFRTISNLSLFQGIKQLTILQNEGLDILNEG